MNRHRTMDEQARFSKPVDKQFSVKSLLLIVLKLVEPALEGRSGLTLWGKAECTIGSREVRGRRVEKHRVGRRLPLRGRLDGARHQGVVPNGKRDVVGKPLTRGGDIHIAPALQPEQGYGLTTGQGEHYGVLVCHIHDLLNQNGRNDFSGSKLVVGTRRERKPPVL